MGAEMNTAERDQFYDELVRRVDAGEMTWGEVVRALRRQVAGLNQQNFAKVTKISVRTLRNLERDDGNPTLATLEAVLSPFGLATGLRRSR